MNMFRYQVQDSNNYKEAMKILKLVVTRCSTLVVPPYWDSHASSILDTELHGKKVSYVYIHNGITGVRPKWD